MNDSLFYCHTHFIFGKIYIRIGLYYLSIPKRAKHYGILDKKKTMNVLVETFAGT